MDEVDYTIVKLLKKDSRMSYTKIGRELGITEGAVRKRVHNLVKSEIIKRFTLDVEDKTGVRTLLMVKVNTKVPNPQVAQGIHEVKYVDRVFEVSGSYDLVVQTSAPDIDSMNATVDRVRAVNGVEDTNTVLILKEWY